MPGSWKTGGLKPAKYVLFKVRADGEVVAPDPEARYFVLRYDADPHAREALQRYADRVQRDNPQLAADLCEELARVPLKEGDPDVK